MANEKQSPWASFSEKVKTYDDELSSAAGQFSRALSFDATDLNQSKGTHNTLSAAEGVSSGIGMAASLAAFGPHAALAGFVGGTVLSMFGSSRKRKAAERAERERLERRWRQVLNQYKAELKGQGEKFRKISKKAEKFVFGGGLVDFASETRRAAKAATRHLASGGIKNITAKRQIQSEVKSIDSLVREQEFQFNDKLTRLAKIKETVDLEIGAKRSVGVVKTERFNEIEQLTKDYEDKYGS